MQELLDTLDGWRAEGAGIGRAVVVRTFGSRAAARGRRPAARRRRADRGLGERRLRRGGRGRGDRPGPQGRPQPRDPLRDQRRGGVGRRARVRRDDRRARGAGRSTTRRSPAPTPAGARWRRCCPRTRRRPRSGATSRATGRRPPDRIVDRRGRVDGRLAGHAGRRRRAAGRRRGRAAARDLADGRRSATARCSSRRSRSGRGS